MQSSKDRKNLMFADYAIQLPFFPNIEVLKPYWFAVNHLEALIGIEGINQEALNHNITWYRIPLKDPIFPKKVYEKMKYLFQCERGSMGFVSPAELCFFGFDGNECVGCISVSTKWAVDWVWLHPYLRGKGTMTRFFLYYSLHEAPLIPAPPVSKAMFICCEKVNSQIKKDETLLKESANTIKKWLKRITPGDVADIDKYLITIDDILRFWMALAVLPDDLAEKFYEDSSLITSILKTVYYMNHQGGEAAMKAAIPGDKLEKLGSSFENTIKSKRSDIKSQIF